MSQNELKDSPVRKSVKVDCPQEDAFRFFTEDIASWWPLEKWSISGEPEACVIEPWVGGRVFERSRSGQEYDWGTVTAWDPPNRLAFTWGDAGEQQVDVAFIVEADATKVQLTHTAGFSRPTAQASVAPTWAAVLERHFGPFIAEQVLVVC